MIWWMARRTARIDVRGRSRPARSGGTLWLLNWRSPLLLAGGMVIGEATVSGSAWWLLVAPVIVLVWAVMAAVSERWGEDIADADDRLRRRGR